MVRAWGSPSKCEHTSHTLCKDKTRRAMAGGKHKLTSILEGEQGEGPPHL
jgi:hypothetical protein